MTSSGAAGPGPTLAIGRLERRLRDGQRSSRVEIVDCEFWPGTCYSLVGESGIGKTTSLEMLALARPPDSIDGFTFRQNSQEIDLGRLLSRGDHETLSAVRARHFGYVTQTSLLLPFLTVRENVEVAQRIAGIADPSTITRLLDELELSTLARIMPGALSGGQRQRACVARALAHRPAVVLADEPTSSVDAEMGRLIMRMIRTHVEQTGAVALVITHNLAMVREFALTELAVRSVSMASGLHTTVSSPPSPPTSGTVSAEVVA